ncbi:MAG TPA: ATP-binding protein [Candidatus Bathyarchaeia archaeon]|nr:ATP-binding protein [Candidatus Bathyarchaeia archaeon]
MKPSLHPEEQARLAALRQYKILDTAPEQGFDDLTLLASHICETPIALISLVDSDRQWFKSRVGLTAEETPRDQAFCAFAILQKELLVVKDATQDPRFSDNPLVQSDPQIRFYAGAQLYSSDELPLGALCVIDRKPRQLSECQYSALEALSRQVQAQLELRRNLLELKQALELRDQAERVQQQLMQELQRAFNDTRRLSDLLPVSSACKFSVTIPADINRINPVAEGVMEVARQMQCAQGRELEIDLAVREALANAILHGCKSDASKSIQCSVACDQGGEILLVIRDPGGHLNKSAVADPTQGDNVYATHGRGLYLIDELMDDVEYVVEKAVSTEVRMRAKSRQPTG